LAAETVDPSVWVTIEAQGRPVALMGVVDPEAQKCIATCQNMDLI